MLSKLISRIRKKRKLKSMNIELRELIEKTKIGALTDDESASLKKILTYRSE